MFTEKRRQLRVDTHIPAEMIVKETMDKLHGFLADIREEMKGRNQESSRVLYGYVENISEGGIGVSSIDTLLPGTRVLASIGPIEAQTISPTAILVFSRIDNSLFYYGFQFMVLSQDEHRVVRRLIRSLRTAPLE